MHRTRAYISAFLALVLISASVTPAVAATQSELERHRAAAAEAKRKAAEATQLATRLDQETARLDKRIDSLQADVNKLDPVVDEAARRLTGLVSQVDSLRRRVAVLEHDIYETQSEYDRQSALLANRITETYRQGDWYYIEILLGAKDFGDLIARGEFITRVLEANRRDAIDLDQTKRNLETSQIQLETALTQVSEKRAEAAAVEQRWRKLRDERQGKLDEQQSIFGQKKRLLAATRKNIERLKAIAAAEDRASDRIAAQLYGTGSGIYHGTMQWPTPGYFEITSSFGYRMHPILGYRRFHAGVDIAAPTGATIVAAGDGTVISAGYYGGYGNVVMVDHGNGVVTVYAHQSLIGTTVGARVSKGERVGAVGSTGLSTGPHLHFEVRINGRPVDPINYLR